VSTISNLPERIVISRKGFDSSAGGCASPILSGEMISLPIPEHNNSWRRSRAPEFCKEKHLTYAELGKRCKSPITDLVTQLSRGRIREADCVHLDPDIRRSLRNLSDKKMPLTFGQDRGSQTELRALEAGDLFLYFGWFRKAIEIRPRNYTFARDGADVHAIWGWLQLGMRLDLPEKISLAHEVAGHHPHVSYHADRSPNCLYVASDKLSIFPDISGAGTFSEFRSELCLSDRQENLPPRRKLRSAWCLPAFFRNIRMTHHQLSEWDERGDCIYGKGGAYRGQEFVFETRGSEKEVAKWLESIFKGGIKNS
jgi:hypothetical protein